jgi:hypothetical protein
VKLSATYEAVTKDRPDLKVVRWLGGDFGDGELKPLDSGECFGWFNAKREEWLKTPDLWTSDPDAPYVFDTVELEDAMDMILSRWVRAIPTGHVLANTGLPIRDKVWWVVNRSGFAGDFTNGDRYNTTTPLDALAVFFLKTQSEQMKI